MQEAEASMAEDKGVPVVRLDCSEVGWLCGLERLRGDGGLGGADGARAQEGVRQTQSVHNRSARPFGELLKREMVRQRAHPKSR